MSVTIVPGQKLTELQSISSLDLTSLFYTVSVGNDESYSTTLSSIKDALVQPLGDFFLPYTGGTMTGHISSNLTPINSVQLTNKAYVDSLYSSLTSLSYLYNNFLPLSGGTMTGHISTGSLAEPVNGTELVNKTYADKFVPLAGGTMTGPLTLNADPTLGGHAATKSYVDGLSTIATTTISRLFTNNTNDCRDNMGRWCSYILDSNNTLRTSGLFGYRYNGGQGYFSTIYDEFRPSGIEFVTTTELPLSVLQNGYSTWVLSNSGRIYGAGNNSAGQLGLGDNNRRNVFTALTSLADVTSITINSADYNEESGNTSTTVFAISNYKLYGWGSNAQGQLGLQDSKGNPQRGDSDYNFYTPQLISVQSSTSKVKSVVTTGKTSTGSSYVILTGGEVYSTGYNNNGQLGLGTRTNVATFTLVPGISADAVYTSNQGYTTYILRNGSLSAAGDNTVGQLGQGTTGAASRFDNTTFKPVMSAAGAPIGNVKYISTNNGVGGIVSTFAITNDNQIFAWGGNNNGQLGTGDKQNRSYATKVATGTKVQVVGSGGNTTSIILSAGVIYTTGYVKYGIDGTGDGNERIKTSFTKTLNPQGVQWADFEAYALGPGTQHRYILALDQYSKIWGWGSNVWSQLGIANRGSGLVQNPDLIDVPVKISIN